MARAKSDHWTEAHVFAALAGPFPDGAFVRIPSVRNGTGFKRKTTTADALIVSCWPSRGLWFAGVEIKVSRGDWRRELAKPDKAAEIQQWCNYWYVAAPAGVVPLEELPPTWGLIECTGRGCKISKAAPKLKPKPPDTAFVCSVLRASSESMIARAEVENLVELKVEEKLRWAHDNAKRLADDVEKFEKATGVRVNAPWEHGDIAAAVRLLRETKSVHLQNTAQHLRAQAERYVHAACEVMAICDQALAGVTVDEPTA